jgi:hypothetical protein
MTVWGADNELPNQTLVGGSGSILTKGLADGLYAPSSGLTDTTVTEYGVTGPAVGLGGGSATGPNSYAMIGSSATAQGSMASGIEAYAGGNWSTASGFDANAHGTWSNASGAGSAAWGDQSTASGFYSRAYGVGSTASGYESQATGNSSTAAGDFSYAQAYGEFVAGQYNVIEGSTNSWVSTDDLFVVGNGSSGHLSDAIEVLKNGNTTIGGALAVSGTAASSFSGYVGIGTATPASQLEILGSNDSIERLQSASGRIACIQMYDGNAENSWVVGHQYGAPSNASLVFSYGAVGSEGVVAQITSTGGAIFNGSVKVSGSTGGVANAILVNQAGDISMGGFTQGTPPQ